jgi:hypothetical protein
MSRSHYGRRTAADPSTYVHRPPAFVRAELVRAGTMPTPMHPSRHDSRRAMAAAGSNRTGSRALLMGRRQVGPPTATRASASLLLPAPAPVVYGTDGRWSGTAWTHPLERRSDRRHLRGVDAGRQTGAALAMAVS